MKANRRHIFYILYIIAFILLVLSVTAGIAFGSVRLSLNEIFDGLTGKNALAHTIITQLRLPRVLGAALAGAALSSAGLVLQCVTGNGLCAPNIVGINSGAGFAVILMLCYAPSAWHLLPAGAFVGALTATGLITLISFSDKYKRPGSVLVLAGVAVSSLLNSAISFLSLKFPDVLTSYAAFSVGGFSGVHTEDIVVPAIIIITALLILQMITPGMTLLCLGDEIAASLGVRVRALRTASLILASALCAAAVSFAGLLGFVGLVVPHIVRRLAGNDMKINLMLSAFFGAVLVIMSDIAGRTLFSPSEIPAGIIMAFIGAPFFLYLLIARRHSVDKM